MIEKSYPLKPSIATSPICCGSSTGNDLLTELTGTFTRIKTGNSFKVKNAPEVDVDIFPPSRVSNFKSKVVDYVIIEFTAPGDDFDDGVSFRYEIKFTDDPVYFTSSNLWNELDDTHVIKQENIIQGSLDPVLGGTNIILSVDSELFEAQTVYYLAMTAYDEQNNVGEVSNFAQILVKPQCDVTGKCKGYPVLSLSITKDQTECLNHCKFGPYQSYCHWITFDPDTGLCELFEDCNVGETGDCKNCISSEVYCDTSTEPACYVSGLCQVSTKKNIPKFTIHNFV